MIIAFSGTGNSLYAARLLSASLGESAGSTVVLEGDALLHPENAEFSTGRDETVIWVFPVYSWGVPPVVADVIRKAKFSGSMGHAVHHAVITYGDDAGLTGKQWRRLLTSRRCRPGGVYGVRMPNVYTLMKGFDTDAPVTAEMKLHDTPGRMESIARRIKANRHGRWEDDYRKGSFAWIKSALIYPWFVRRCMSPKPFRHTEECTSCGLCSRSCPMENIAMKPGGPEWGKHCALCLRCYHICPHHAVAYGKATDGKGQYICPEAHLKAHNNTPSDDVIMKSGR